jgi:formylglycine-generating enzyme required for sulfatase activity
VGCSDTEYHLLDYAWYVCNTTDELHAVGTKLDNPWGLFDTSGNAAEWVWDGYATYPEGAATDPLGDEEATNRAVRGGDYDDSAAAVQPGSRANDAPTNRTSSRGFRLVRTVQE